MGCFDVEEDMGEWERNTYYPNNVHIHDMVFCDECGSFNVEPGDWVKAYSEERTVSSGWLIKTSKQIRIDYYLRQAICMRCGASNIVEKNQDPGKAIDRYGGLSPKAYYNQMRSKARSQYFAQIQSTTYYYWGEEIISKILSEITNGELPGRIWKTGEWVKSESVKV